MPWNDNFAWEHLSDGDDSHTMRAKVPGGWLYKETSYGSRPSVSICFVPKPVRGSNRVEDAIMGYYINPPGMSKERWLQAYSDKSVAVPDPDEATPGKHWVIWVDNGPFTAAAVAYNRAEFRYFLDHPDARPRRWFLVKDDHLTDLEPMLKDVMEPYDG
jgi:hypothetical protein